jgi:hypothetical protein
MTAPSTSKAIAGFFGFFIFAGTLYGLIFRQIDGNFTPITSSIVVPSRQMTVLWKPDNFGTPIFFGAVTARREIAGIEIVTFDRGGFWNHALIMIPTWLLALVGIPLGIGLMIPEFLHHRVMRREKRRIKIGLCPQCGYDVRMQPKGGKCPECEHFVL